MRDITAELKELRLYGMAGAWQEVAADQNGLGVQTSRWLIERAGPVQLDKKPTVISGALRCRVIHGAAAR